jgi:hypothetical protein
VYSKYTYVCVRLNQDKRFNKTKNEIALLICFLVDYSVCKSTIYLLENVTTTNTLEQNDVILLDDGEEFLIFTKKLMVVYLQNSFKFV